jgi:hypothetical protein
MLSLNPAIANGVGGEVGKNTGGGKAYNELNNNLLQNALHSYIKGAGLPISSQPERENLIEKLIKDGARTGWDKEGRHVLIIPNVRPGEEDRKYLLHINNDQFRFFMSPLSHPDEKSHNFNTKVGN